MYSVKSEVRWCDSSAAVPLVWDKSYIAVHRTSKIDYYNLKETLFNQE